MLLISVWSQPCDPLSSFVFLSLRLLSVLLSTFPWHRIVAPSQLSSIVTIAIHHHLPFFLSVLLVATIGIIVSSCFTCSTLLPPNRVLLSFTPFLFFLSFHCRLIASLPLRSPCAQARTFHSLLLSLLVIRTLSDFPYSHVMCASCCLFSSLSLSFYLRHIAPVFTHTYTHTHFVASHSTRCVSANQKFGDMRYFLLHTVYLLSPFFFSPPHTAGYVSAYTNQ